MKIACTRRIIPSIIYHNCSIGWTWHYSNLHWKGKHFEPVLRLRLIQATLAEALEALCDFSFNKLHATKLYITNDSENLPSNKLAIKAGFTLIDTIHKHIKNTDGELRDTNVYSLTL